MIKTLSVILALALSHAPIPMEARISRSIGYDPRMETCVGMFHDGTPVDYAPDFYMERGTYMFHVYVLGNQYDVAAWN